MTNFFCILNINILPLDNKTIEFFDIIEKNLQKGLNLGQRLLKEIIFDKQAMYLSVMNPCVYDLLNVLFKSRPVFSQIPNNVQNFFLYLRRQVLGLQNDIKNVSFSFLYFSSPLSKMWDNTSKIDVAIFTFSISTKKVSISFSCLHHTLFQFLRLVSVDHR